MKTTNWHRATTLGGDGLTSRLTGRPVAATDTCVGVIRACSECGARYYATPDAPHHGDHLQTATARGHAPTVVTSG